MTERPRKLDVFISHASEDKDAFVRPLVVALQTLGVSVWYDEFSLEVGDSISRSIDRELAESAYGIAVISPAFIGKSWPEYELRGLVSREIEEAKVILPIWRGVTREQVVRFSPTLADKLAIDTSRVGSQEVAIQILKVVHADLYEQHHGPNSQGSQAGGPWRICSAKLSACARSWSPPVRNSPGIGVPTANPKS